MERGRWENALAGIVGTVRTTAKASTGWRRSSKAAVQDDCSGSTTMPAGAASDRGESRLKATCDGLALLDQHGVFDVDGQWQLQYVTAK